MLFGMLWGHLSVCPSIYLSLHISDMSIAKVNTTLFVCLSLRNFRTTDLPSSCNPRVVICVQQMKILHLHFHSIICYAVPSPSTAPPPFFPLLSLYQQMPSIPPSFHSFVCTQFQMFCADNKSRSQKEVRVLANFSSRCFSLSLFSYSLLVCVSVCIQLHVCLWMCLCLSLHLPFLLHRAIP